MSSSTTSVKHSQLHMNNLTSDETLILIKDMPGNHQVHTISIRYQKTNILQDLAIRNIGATRNQSVSKFQFRPVAQLSLNC